MRSGVQTVLSFARNPLSLVSRETRSGRCNVCGHEGRFLLRWTHRRNLRETLGCPRCGSISRDRMLVSVMSQALGRPPILADWPADPTVRVLEPSARRGRAEIVGTKVEHHAVEYPGVDLEALPYPEGHFDWVVAADVLEHVRRDEPAIREVFRVLRPRGWFFLQVPFDAEKETLVRIEVAESGDRHLLPAEYHAGRTLVYRRYGRDLPRRLEAFGFEVEAREVESEEWAIPRQTAFVCRKP